MPVASAPIGMRRRPGRVRGPTAPQRAPFWSISGVTRDTNSAALGAVTVDLFRSVDDLWLATTVSDASGNYAFYSTILGPYYCVAYLSGSPDRAGTTVQTLLESLVRPG
jgi:hypothetical protein